MLPEQRLEHRTVHDPARPQAKLGDASASPDARRFPAPLRWGQVVPGTRRAGAILAPFRSADLLPRVGGVVALGNGDDPGHRSTSSPHRAGRQPGGTHHDH